MKEYIITVKDNPYHITIKKIRTDTAVVEVDGEEYEVGVDRKLKRHIAPLEVKPIPNQPMKSAPLSPTGTTDVSLTSGEDVLAPLPGLILNLLVKEGDKVKSGQTVMKMEAMKMENEIQANKTGSVAKIFVFEGQSVLENTPLLRIGE